MTQTFIDVHILQDLPPSNINRDDNGTPKHATYGGVERLRISSQAWKRATRLHFTESMDGDQLGVRTRRLEGLLTGLMVQRGVDEEVASVRAHAALTSLNLKSGKKEDQSQYLLFAGRRQLDELAAALAETDDVSGVPAADIIGSIHPLDVALFGRMVADMTQLNVDASAQVAHALSTHGASTQFDYFTAVDDEQEKDEAGAGMIGMVEFNAATVYRFATVGLEQLVENMGDRQAAVDGVGRFIRSFALSMPTGFKNSFAPRTRPALVAVVIRRDQPVNLVSAFERPIAAGTQGYLAGSLRRLADYHSAEVERWGDKPALTVASFSADEETSRVVERAFGAATSLDEMVSRVMATVAEGSHD